MRGVGRVGVGVEHKLMASLSVVVIVVAFSLVVSASAVSAASLILGFDALLSPWGCDTDQISVADLHPEFEFRLFLEYSDEDRGATGKSLRGQPPVEIARLGRRGWR